MIHRLRDLLFVGSFVLSLVASGCGGSGGVGGGPGLPPRELLVTNLGGNSVVGFPVDESTGEVMFPPSRVIQGSQTGLHNPMAITMLHSGELFVANLGDASTNGPSVTVYDVGAMGDVAPMRTLQGGATELSLPNGIVASRWPGFLVTNHVNATGPPGTMGVLEFSDDPAVTAPTGGTFGSNTTIAGPMGIAKDSQNRIFITEPGSDRILGFQAQGNTVNDIAPLIVIAGAQTLLDRPMGVAFDSADNMFVVNQGDSSITIYAPNQNGDVAPVRRIKGPSTQLYEPAAIAVDDVGRIYVSQTNRMLAFGLAANGNVPPTQNIQDPSLSGTMGLVVR